MSGVIYADVLVIINFYITYFLLLCASFLSREKPDRLRIALSSFFGGFYALLVLVPIQSVLLNILIKVVAITVPVLIVAGIRSVRSFIRFAVSYLVCNFVFAGLMFALWYFVSPMGMVYDGAVVYFDIDVLTLVIFIVVCYVFMRIFDFLFKSRAPVNTVYYCDVSLKGKRYCLKAFLDTGNNLSDPFTGKPIIVAYREIFSSLFDFDSPTAEGGLRFVLCTTVSGKSLLASASADSVSVKGADICFETDSVMIAFTNEKLLGGDYDAILPMGLFDKNYDRKDERENEKTTVTF